VFYSIFCHSYSTVCNVLVHFHCSIFVFCVHYILVFKDLEFREYQKNEMIFWDERMGKKMWEMHEAKKCASEEWIKCYPIFSLEIGSWTGIVFRYLIFQVILIFSLLLPNPGKSG
jgi:hypothetical protein